MQGVRAQALNGKRGGGPKTSSLNGLGLQQDAKGFSQTHKLASTKQDPSTQIGVGWTQP